MLIWISSYMGLYSQKKCDLCYNNSIKFVHWLKFLLSWTGSTFFSKQSKVNKENLINVKNSFGMWILPILFLKGLIEDTHL